MATPTALGTLHKLTTSSQQLIPSTPTTTTSVASTAGIQIESADVLKLIHQFLRENHLHATLHALQEESQVTLNTVENEDTFKSDILSGRWESVLTITQTLTLPHELMSELMIQIVYELAEMKELETARALLRNAPALIKMKQSSPEHYLMVDHLLARAGSGAFDATQAYGGGGREGRRKALATALSSHVQAVPPSRLLALLAQSMKYQQLTGLLPKGSRFDLLSGAAPMDQSVTTIESYPTKNSRIIKFGSKSYPECARFSPDGQLLASGSCDGYIELWNADTGKLNLEYSYQADDQLMSHDSAVLCLAFSLNMELLVSGSTKGDIKVWRIATGSCVRKFPTAHTEGITQVEFTREGTSVLSASFDGLVRLHGLKSGRTLKEFRGHSSFVTGFVVTDEVAATSARAAIGERLLSTSADGTVRVWDLKTADCLRVIRLTGGAGGPPPSLLAIQTLPLSHLGSDRFVLVERSGTLRIIDMDGGVLTTLQSTSSSSTSSSAASAPLQTEAQKAAAATNRKRAGKDDSRPSAAGDFVAVACSPKGKYVYGVTEECVLHCFEMVAVGAELQGKLVHAIKLHRADTLGLVHHPHKNLLASISQEGNIKLWTP